MCHNFGNKARDFKINPVRPFTQGKEECPPKLNVCKNEQNQEKCGLMLYAQKQENKWYVDNGFLRKKTRDQRKFIKIKELHGGKVIPRNNSFAKIVQKVINIDNGRNKAQNSLL